MKLLLAMTLQASVLIAAILLLRAVFLHRLPKRAFLALWGVAVLRLLVPFTLPSPISVYTFLAQGPLAAPAVLPGADAPLLPAVARAAFEAASPLPAHVDAAVAAVPSTAGLSPLLLLWLVGAGILAAFFLITHLQCRRRYRAALPSEDIAVAHWLENVKLTRPLHVMSSDQILAPLTYGVFRPVILLPKTIDLSDGTRLGYVLAHEYIHVRRFDALYKWLLALALCVHWFNPLVWALYLLAGRDIEFSCDEAVVRAMRGDERTGYARALLSMEAEKSGMLSLYSGFSKNALKERIEAIMKLKKQTRVGIILALALVVCTTAVFATSAARTAVPQTSDPAHINMDDALFDYGVPMDELWASATDITAQVNGGTFMDQPYHYTGTPLVYKFTLTAQQPHLWMSFANGSADNASYTIRYADGSHISYGGILADRPFQTHEADLRDAASETLYFILYRLDGGDDRVLHPGPLDGTFSVRADRDWQALCKALAPTEALRNDPKNIFFTVGGPSRNYDFTVTKEQNFFRVWARNDGQHDFRLSIQDADGNTMSTQPVLVGGDAILEGAYNGDTAATYTIVLSSPIGWDTQGVFSYKTGTNNDGIWSSSASWN